MPVSLLSWAARCTPGLTAVAIIVLSILTLADLSPIWRLVGVLDRHEGSSRSARDGTAVASYPLLFWITYSVFVHFVAFAFPLRLCRATWQLTERMEEAHAKLARGLPLERGRPRARSSIDSDSVPDSPATPVDEKSNFVTSSRELYEPVHTILLPCYKEDIENIKFTLKVLASHDLAPVNYDIFLAMEQRDPTAIPVAQTLVQLFKTRFLDIQYTLHPGNLPGEAAGKSSNISWSAKEALFKYKSSQNWKDTLITVMDSDTHLSADYFKLLESRHKANRDSGIRDVLYMPPIVFDRNALRVPTLVRIADMMWSGACLSMCGNTSVVSIPTSVYTVPMTLASRVGGWDTGPEAIGEDLHMMLKCYFGTFGNLDMQVIPSPASQCNVSSSELGVRGWVAGLQARYWQGLRHMWGCLDTGYSIEQWCEMRRRGEDNEVSTNNRDDYVETTRSLSLQSSASSETLVSSDGEQNSAPADMASGANLPRPSTWYRTLTVFFRLFEAHMVPIHMAVVLIASAVYGNVVPSNKQPYAMTVGLFLMGTSRTLAFGVMVLYFVVFYDKYHRLAVERREAEMKRVKLYEECDLPSSFAHRRTNDWRCWADCFLFAVGGFVFGSLPAMHAVIAHFFTNRLEYVVSSKPKVKALAAESEPEKKV